MDEWKVKGQEDKKNVIIEIADVFFEMHYPDGSTMEEIPDTTLIEDDKERKEQEKVLQLSEKEAQMKVIKNAIAKAEKEGYKFYKLLTQAQASRLTGQSLALGLNGMYLLMFWTTPLEKAKSFHTIDDLEYINKYFEDFEHD